MGDESELPPGLFVRQNFSPLQIPGQDNRIGVFTIGGPDLHRDAVLILDMKELLALIRVAKESGTGRVVLPCPGVKIDTYRGGNGRMHEVWHLVSGPPTAENSSAIDSLMGR